ncbi:hypothetical protein TanjilG_18872 [Lupinus angustifolius]|uniref:C2H2-type domain-containing protein n=1 Tax=Lupinus angustifolius TaxID=3871 RepID=A0A4P1RQR3_LUPAN|nr:PREDICTED: probable transcriptional regulator RABBIT EARS [Lupinus angustifolius]OIW16157.1 hypothetical protein TanjilG_18872 [Lupinus angustifolius]
MMEESEYLMWMKRKQLFKSHLQAVEDGSNNNYYYSSWAERAFAEDAGRVLGGSMWPPRSYSCTFCKREFRSAQALGGHMNVHRRDRARLNQNLSPNNDQTLVELDHHKNDCKSLGTQLFSQISCSQQLHCCLNPNSSLATSITTTRISPSGLSGISKGKNCGQHILSPYSSTINIGSPYSEHEGIVDATEEGKFKGLGCNNYVETSLSVGLSSSMFPQKSSPIIPSGDKTMISCKRLKTNISSLPVKSLKPCSNDRGVDFQSAEVIMEDLDLELRLGKQQKVK